MGVVYPGIKRFVQKIIHLMKLKYCASPCFKNGSRISPKRVTPHFTVLPLEFLRVLN